MTHPLNRLIKPLQEFIRLEAAGGLVLMATAVLALVVANSPLAASYTALLNLSVEVRVGSFGIAKPLLLWINDGLMAIFFFLVGLELKREILEGHLSTLRKASLPVFAALGGMVLPAACYAALNWGDGLAMRGWAIPTATDIAFALGVLSLLGERVPTTLKAFLLSVAIFDDLGAIIVIALFYTAKLSLVSLGVAAVLILALAALNRLGVTRPAAFILVGLPLWVAVLKSGVHATLAGVVLAMFIPLRVEKSEPGAEPAASLLRHLEHVLHPWVAFGVLPVFALANAGVPLGGLSLDDVFHAVPLGIMAGLFLGKQVGVLGACWLAIRLRLAALPEGVGWRQLHGITLLCGIGFTMSLFIASLAFDEGAGGFGGLERLGILGASFVSGLLGYLALRAAPGRGDEPGSRSGG
ncbi:MAG: Na+/H+ antiporter NhaA [Acidobacteriota bacterium]|nr:Na+/H+ antiporter NhaA [Acidobacteriota bacterium]